MAILTSFLTSLLTPHQKFVLGKFPYAYYTLVHHLIDGVPISDMTVKSDTHCHIVSFKDLADYVLEDKESRLVRVKAINVTNYEQRVREAFRTGDLVFLKAHREMLHPFSKRRQAA